MRSQVKTCKLLGARENASGQVVIGFFGFQFDFLRKWREFSGSIGLIALWSKAKPQQSRIILDSQNKLLYSDLN